MAMTQNPPNRAPLKPTIRPGSPLQAYSSKRNVPEAVRAGALGLGELADRIAVLRGNMFQLSISIMRIKLCPPNMGICWIIINVNPGLINP